VCLSAAVYIVARIIHVKFTEFAFGGRKMAFCGKCGSQLHDNATFCANCGSPTGVAAGTPQAAAAAAPVPQQVYVAPAAGPHQRGFFSSLFDISFTSFITSKIIKVIYVLLMIVLAIAVVVLVIQAQNMPSPTPILAIVVAPIVFFLYLMLIRMQLEILIVIFRISENVRDIADELRQRGI